MIHFYELSTMNASQRLRLFRRAELEIDEPTESVRPIIQTEGYTSLNETTQHLAEVEGFPAHVNAVTNRFS